ncbi:selenocysteine-specific translation elongation factor [Actinomadura viridis]|uniref:Selenocysteine-specific elongation factor n=1 Tax=Actinomadura viridis TaxID=58110 RepID=A0A931DMY8_9ACTN|nr:SelB C-terminal domain-containing protein [Actinomadura viridis]MBG6090075.1 selenocysteine-specific elongation factor [Actinomadura viridis]
MQVVATAGHVDHGKSSLVRAITGGEPGPPDGEPSGGPALDLEFASTTLPSGERLAFVDVPGHERFMGTMLAGVGPVPAVLLAVAADQGWMPQTEEHLAAVDALGVRHGVLAVTRSDLADPTIALRQARERVAKTALRGSEAVTVSAATGAGLDQLTAALDRLAARLPVPDETAPVRLWVDRARAGAGAAVVTGTLTAGTVEAEDELILMPAGERVRVRHVGSAAGEPAARVRGVARVELHLGGVRSDRLARGMALVSPGRWTPTGSVDVRTRFGEASGRLARQMILHIGSAAVAVRLRPLGPDTARLTLNSRLPLHVGDSALLRDPARRAVAGVSVLDVRPPTLVRRGAGAARARELASWPDRPDGGLVLRRYGVLRRSELTVMGCAAPPAALSIEFPDGRGDGRPGDEWLADPDHWEDLHRRLAAELDRHAAAHPLAPGLSLESARLRLGLPSRRLVAALVREPLHLREGRVYGPPPALAPDTSAAVRRVLAGLGPFETPSAERMAESGLTPGELAAAGRAGALLYLAGGLVLPPGAGDEALRVLSGLPQPFTVGTASRALGADRRTTVALLEHLDRRGLTRRAGDRRVLGEGDGPDAPAPGK